MEERIQTSIGTSDSVKVFGEKVQTVEITIEGFSSDVTLDIEGKIKNGWTTMSETGDTTFTGNGTHILNIVDVVPSELRTNWKSGSATSVKSVFKYQ